jgi:hypothetical protein
MTLRPDGNLYVSNVGFGPPPVGARASAENHFTLADTWLIRGRARQSGALLFFILSFSTG